MFPLKRFIQGPSLHEESVAHSSVKRTRNTGGLNGEEASKAYEEIINLPSTSSSVAENEKSSLRKPIAHIKREPGTSDETVPPKLSRLFTYCESNDYKQLEKTLSEFKNVIDVDLVDEFGWTMLMSASCAGSLECVTILLQYGANWSLTDKKGQTAFCLAKKRHHTAVHNRLQEWIEYITELQSRLHDVDEDDDVQYCGDSSSTSKYCESCKINYESAQEFHEKSIAHLVSTSQFGVDKIHFGIPESNKGFQLMVKSGWNKNSGLGPEGTGQKFPVKTILKRNKLGLGNEKEAKAARITHFGPFDSAAVEFPERIEREVTVRRREAVKQRCKEKRKEIDFRREFSGL